MSVPPESAVPPPSPPTPPPSSSGELAPEERTWGMLAHLSSLLGGLLVKVGSRMIDSSLRTKLAGLAAAMKGN